MTTSRDTGTQHKLRMPPELKEKLFSSAKEMNRSLNAEIVARLEQSFEPEVRVSETLEFQLMMHSYLEQAKQIKELKEMLEQVLKKG
ncbi:Arc family DNA-binding protein [Acinetobacter johnsonii]|uniref:Arc family DNA-binding protein n=1 Tax=Acinetobacter johnsonii TaxID=40214 RepID=UPI003CEFDAF0